MVRNVRAKIHSSSEVTIMGKGIKKLCRIPREKYLHVRSNIYGERHQKTLDSPREILPLAGSKV